MGWTIIFAKYSSNWIMFTSRGTYLLLTHEKKSGGCIQLRLVYPAIYQEFKHTLQQLAIQSHLLTKKLHTLMTPKNQHGTWSRDPDSDYMLVFPKVSAGTSNRFPHFCNVPKNVLLPKNVHQQRKLPPTCFLRRKSSTFSASQCYSGVFEH